MSNLQPNLEILIEFLKKDFQNINFDILDKITSDINLFYNFNYFIKKEHLGTLYFEIIDFFETDEYENILSNLMNLYPFTEAVVKKLIETEKSKGKECIIIKKFQELHKYSNSSKENLELKEFEEIYTEEYLNSKKIELQQKKEEFDKRKREVKKIEEEIEKFKNEIYNDIDKYPTNTDFEEFKKFTKKIVYNENTAKTNKPKFSL